MRRVAVPAAELVQSPSVALSRAIDFFRGASAEGALIVMREVTSSEDQQAALADCVSLARRLPSAGVFLNRAAQDVLRSTTDLEVTFEDFGSLGEPGTERVERIYGVWHTAIPEPTKPLVRKRGNCPRLTKSFVGRHDEVNRLEALIADVGLITVTGAPGVGKTTLTKRVLRSMLDEFEDGIWWFALSDCTSWDDVRGKITGEEELCNGAGAVRMDALAQLIAVKKAVVVFDGCEHLRSQVAEFARHLQAATSSLTLICTSQSPLAIDGEHLLPLDPLRCRPNELDTEGTFLESDALDLLYQRAEEVGVELGLDAETVACAARLCGAVDGLPLAIEVLAPALRQTTLSSLLVLVDERNAGLVSEFAPADFDGLDVAMAAGHDLLSQDEQQLLGRLALLKGNWSFAFAAKVLAHLDLTALRRLHQGLFVSSWITYDAATHEYRILSPIRAFLLRGVATATISAHVAALSAILSEVGTSVYTGQREQESVLDTHYSDFLAATKWATTVEEAEPFLSVLVDNLIPCWSRRNMLADASEMAAVVAPKLTGLQRIRMEMMLGIVSLRHGALDAAEQHIQTARKLSVQSGYKIGEAGALCNLAMVLSSRGNYDEALILYGQAVQIFRGEGDTRRMASALGNAADTALRAVEKLPASEQPAALDRVQDSLVETETLDIRDPGILQAHHHNRGRLALLRDDVRGG